MRRAALLLAATLATTAAEAQSERGSLTVHLDDVQESRGDVVVALFRSAEGFPWDTCQATQIRRIAPTARSVTAVFEGLLPGDVAVVAFHDRDEDGDPDLDIEGGPVGGWVVSGPGVLRYAIAALVVDPGGITFTRLRLRYP